VAKVPQTSHLWWANDDWVTFKVVTCEGSTTLFSRPHVSPPWHWASTSNTYCVASI